MLIVQGSYGSCGYLLAAGQIAFGKGQSGIRLSGMNAPLLGQQFRVVSVPLTTIKSSRDLAVDTFVSGKAVASKRLCNDFFSHEKGGVWCVSVAFEDEYGREFTTHFGCRGKDMKVFTDAQETGAPFTARVTTGLGPPQGDLEFEPTSVWYLSDLEPGETRQAQEPLYRIVDTPVLIAS